MRPNYPSWFNIPEHGVPAAQERGALEGDEGTCEQLRPCSLKSRRSFCSVCGACLGFQPGRVSPPSISGIYLASVTRVPRRQAARDVVRPYSLRTGQTGLWEQALSPAWRWLRGDGASPGVPESPVVAPCARQSGAAALGLVGCEQRV